MWGESLVLDVDPLVVAVGVLVVVDLDTAALPLTHHRVVPRLSTATQEKEKGLVLGVHYTPRQVIRYLA